MRRFEILAMALIALAVVAIPAAAQAPAEFPDWMSGSWEMREGTRWTEEFWTDPRGGLMLGASRTGEGETLQSFEHIRIVRGEDGSMSFVAQPRGSEPVPFPLAGAGDDWVEFANPAHDYPQRIRYWREGERLRARISAMDGSRPVEWTFEPMGG